MNDGPLCARFQPSFRVNQALRGSVPRVRTRSSRCAKQTAPRQLQERQSKQRRELNDIFLQPAIAHLDAAEPAFDYQKRMLARGPVARLEPLQISGELVDPIDLVQRNMVARAHCGTDQIKNVEFVRLANTASMSTHDGEKFVFTPDKKTDATTARHEGELPNTQEYVVPFGTCMATQLEQMQYLQQLNPVTGRARRKGS